MDSLLYHLLFSLWPLQSYVSLDGSLSKFCGRNSIADFDPSGNVTVCITERSRTLPQLSSVHTSRKAPFLKLTDNFQCGNKKWEKMDSAVASSLICLVFEHKDSQQQLDQFISLRLRHFFFQTQIETEVSLLCLLEAVQLQQNTAAAPLETRKPVNAGLLAV